MKKSVVLILFLFITVISYSQFEQKVSLNIYAGGFKTFGKAMGMYNYDPMQMPHYRPGITAGAQLQFNFNRHLSFLAEISFMYSGSWFYRMGDYNYLHYTIITDTVTNEVLAEGENRLNLLNFSIGFSPKFYLFAVKKLNPYFFAGVNLNFTHANYTDNIWKDANRLNILPSDDTGPYSPFLENNTGLGFFPGIGIDYNPTEKFSFFLDAGYSLIFMNDKNFKSPYLEENLNAATLRAGIRFSFLKSKNL